MMPQTKASFTSITHGKWILTGEHAVLRGHPAILFPIREKQLILHYWQTDEAVSAEFSGDYCNELHYLFWGAIEHACSILKLNRNQLFGKFYFENNIPIGAGMGASAAFCVGLARWFASQQIISIENLLEFARLLENLFHHESSGADIAVVNAGQGIYFSRHEPISVIQSQWQPCWYLSHSGHAGMTANCVAKVKSLWQTNPDLAQSIDRDMSLSVQKAKEALQSKESNALFQLTMAIQLAYSCFKQWDLCNEAVNKEIHLLLEAGALAAKPTGSGDGGYIISLWESPPSPEMRQRLQII
jgi:mevalonate kinase